PRGRAREILKFILASSPETWAETISGNEEREVGWPVFGLPPSKNIDGERIRCNHTCICDAAGTLNSCPQTEPSALGPATHRSARARDGSQRWLPAPRRAGRGRSPCDRPDGARFRRGRRRRAGRRL